MDIAKARKKFKEAADPDSGRAHAEQAEAPQKEEVPGPSEVGAPAEEQAAKSEAASEDESPDSTVLFLAFKLASEEYAFRIDEIEEIVRPQRITMIPNTEPYLLGITSLRGKIIPVVDLRKMLSLGGRAEEDDRKQKILILKGPKGPIGALIDSVTGVIRPSLSKIVETPLHLPETEMRFIEGVAIVDGRFVSVIRMGEALAI